MRWQWPARIALLLAAPLLLLALLELLGWAVGVQPIAETRSFQARESIRSCRMEPSHVESMCAPEQYLATGQDLVLAFGGSSMQGYPAGEDRKITFYLQQILNTRAPGRYTVRNLGMACKDSIFVRSCVERSIDARPAAIVIYSGHNDFAGFMSRYPEALILTERHGWWLFELRNLLAHTRAFSLLSQRATQAISHENDPRARLSASEIERARGVILDAYTENIRAIAKLAESRDIPVILVTVVSNLHEFPRKMKRWDQVMEKAAADPGTADPWRDAYVRGIESFREERYDEALSSFKDARDHGPRTRAPSILNERIHELGEADPNVHVVDVEERLDRMGGKEGIGCNFFGSDAYCDGVHPNPRTTRLIGQMVAARIVQLRGDRAPR